MEGRIPRGWSPPVARAQAGVFTSAQAIAAGASEAQVRWRRESGAWVVVAGDGLAVAGAVRSALADAFAAALTHPKAVVVLQSAARLHGFPVADDGAVHIHMPHRTRARARLVAHEFRLDPADIVRRRGYAITTAQRTLHDCIGRLDRDQAESLTSWAVARGLVSSTLAARWADPPRQAWGDTRRRRAAEDAAAGVGSTAERRAHEILRRAGISGWRGNVPVHDAAGLIGVADVLFDRERVIVEIDGYAHHGREVFDQDRRRQNRLMMAGYLVLRFTWTDLTTRPAAVAAQVSQAIRARRTPEPGVSARIR